MTALKLPMSRSHFHSSALDSFAHLIIKWRPPTVVPGPIDLQVLVDAPAVIPSASENDHDEANSHVQELV